MRQTPHSYVRKLMYRVIPKLREIVVDLLYLVLRQLDRFLVLADQGEQVVLVIARRLQIRIRA